MNGMRAKMFVLIKWKWYFQEEWLVLQITYLKLPVDAQENFSLVDFSNLNGEDIRLQLAIENCWRWVMIGFE
jgi:hypothetical protein